MTPEETTAETYARVLDIARAAVSDVDGPEPAYYIAAALVDIADTLVAVRTELEEVARRMP